MSLSCSSSTWRSRLIRWKSENILFVHISSRREETKTWVLIKYLHFVEYRVWFDGFWLNSSRVRALSSSFLPCYDIDTSKTITRPSSKGYQSNPFRHSFHFNFHFGENAFTQISFFASLFRCAVSKFQIHGAFEPHSGYKNFLNSSVVIKLLLVFPSKKKWQKA